MENFKEPKIDLLSADGLEVDEQSGSNLKEAGLWAKAIAVIACVIGGLVTLFVFAFGSIFSKSLGLGYGLQAYAGVFIVILFIILGIALIGIINLFRFNSGMVAGINNQDAGAFDKGISGLKNYLILMGILTLLTTFFMVIRLLAG